MLEDFHYICEETPINAKVRKAKEDDLSEIFRLDEKSSNHHAEMDPYFLSASEIDSKHVKDWIKDVIKGDEALVLVIEGGEELVGYFVGVIEETKPFIAPDQEGWLKVAYIEPRWRGKGIARCAMERYKDWYKEHGVESIRLSVHTKNLEAINAWNSLGFEEYMKKMRLYI